MRSVFYVLSMASNYFGENFRFTTWGESHGKAIGCVIDGCPSMINLAENDFVIDMARRKPGQSKFTTQRNEDDKIEILSGVFEGKTTGCPISLLIWNADQKSADYGDIADKFRPGHADYTYFQKYGIRDYRGGGRSSARETAMRVAAGVIAKKILKNMLPDLKITGYITQIGELKINKHEIDLSEIDKNPLFLPIKDTSKFEEYLMRIRKSGDSVGAIIELVASGVPAGIGDPIYQKLDSEIAKAMMSINAVKGVEIGSGFESASLLGSQNSDEMFVRDDKISFSSNHNGGMIGGISSGQDIVVRFAVKPTSSILIPRHTVDTSGNETEIITKGRHDPCVGIRAVPVGEAMLACVLADRLATK